MDTLYISGRNFSNKLKKGMLILQMKVQSSANILIEDCNVTSFHRGRKEVTKKLSLSFSEQKKIKTGTLSNYLRTTTTKRVDFYSLIYLHNMSIRMLNNFELVDNGNVNTSAETAAVGTK